MKLPISEQTETEKPVRVTAAAVPLPARITAERKAAEQQGKPAGGKPQGWWSINDVSGSLDGVCKAIGERAEIPEHWKTAIVADLKSRCGVDFNFVYLDAHFHTEKGNATLHYTCQPDKKLI